MSFLCRSILMLAVVTAGVVGPVARSEADPLTISIADLDALRLVGTSPGATVNLFGTLRNNTQSTLFLNGSGQSSQHGASLSNSAQEWSSKAPTKPECKSRT